jgi:tRNA (cmo5U34)-methyltransferase
MVNRSAPFYGEMQRMMAELVADYAKPVTDVYDLGCATGISLYSEFVWV